MIEILKVLSVIPGLGVILYFLMEDESIDLADRISYLFGGIPWDMPKDPLWPRA